MKAKGLEDEEEDTVTNRKELKLYDTEAGKTSHICLIKSVLHILI